MALNVYVLICNGSIVFTIKSVPPKINTDESIAMSIPVEKSETV
jgi:hypothetical protein